MQRGSLVRGGKDLLVGSKPVRPRWPQAKPDDIYERLSGWLVGDPSALAGNGAGPPQNAEHIGGAPADQNECVGAIGVSGVQSHEDEQIALKPG